MLAAAQLELVLVRQLAIVKQLPVLLG